MDSLATLASCGTTTMIEVEDRSKGLLEGDKDVTTSLDDSNGYSTDLSRVIREIGTAVAAVRHGASASEQANMLERAIFAIMERDNNSEPSFYPGVVERLSPQAIQEYSLCNQAYQHTALIYVRWQLRSLPRDAPEIQDSVKRIIECVSSISPSYGLSPHIVLTTPLFTAGCEALGEDRKAIRRLLSQLYDLLKIRNIKLALEVLEAFWADESVKGDLGMLLRMTLIILRFVQSNKFVQVKRTGTLFHIEGFMNADICRLISEEIRGLVTYTYVDDDGVESYDFYRMLGIGVDDIRGEYSVSNL